MNLLAQLNILAQQVFKPGNGQQKRVHEKNQWYPNENQPYQKEESQL
ncbi:hypothetical protein RO3G_02481 [Rhizopus delemar RA 99-880]|uniref:Uncharacterized protein n=1 Tax=Rhizopus delemar (strain RA 99-880 / ATCC MYA-4621 / FGSC 9543 / NRRL 43880) TaxID=246409 RepID=I1BNJ7_RHIO9|nr:hypothetical protein RO3G_02481 [Rhizopus delemar RA 99-880]|eukprot:EIE77777.1 hypothetical protein RO3G_02481 [Rhizopus delemar RA 99-880]